MLGRKEKVQFFLKALLGDSMISKIQIISSSVLLAGSFLLGSYITSVHYSLKLKSLELQLAEQSIQSLEDKDKKQQQYFSGVINAQNSYDLSTSGIYNSFSTHLASAFNDTSYSLSVSKDQSGSTLSDHSSDSGKTLKETRCECNGSDRAELQRIRKLYEKELINSRDCDLKTAQLNALIDIVKTISN